MNTESLDLSVVIITLNEENNLRQCLKALPQGAEIVVLDSGSSDQTLNIAREFGAQVSHREFDHYSGQKNAALEHASRKWILSLDADEVLDDALRASIISVVQGGGQPHIKGYRLARHLVFLGRQLRFGKTRDYPLRMFLRHEEHVFSSPIHEKISINPAQVAVLPGSLLHFSYDSLSNC
jgi:glycosyltransferase involved in cell wall biosynthesis